ncbi:MAG: KpsF/GutQ family sugar-phosphate isomerase [Prevotellaceae bacterium]|jgi:arabinose-5-phosphate isomerase|nr:KpsF/GutQ family sugar-phosphate isomerase [Prevotellaceae bacterium]
MVKYRVVIRKLVLFVIFAVLSYNKFKIYPNLFMMSGSVDVRQIAVDSIVKEADSIRKLASFIDENFIWAVELLYGMSGRVVVSGIGKSAIIAQKVVATFNSTGTPAIFMHAGDALHGDLGMVQPGDVVLCLSKSGNTPEIKALVPLVRQRGNRLVAVVSDGCSYLAGQADCVLRATVDEEACPWNLAPTSSTTAQLVMGDALAICLMCLRGFTSEDFARVHPGGSLGKRLYLRVGDLVDPARCPQVLPETTIHRTIMTISENRLGATAVVDGQGVVVGIITDGDVRRMIERNRCFDGLTARDIMCGNPKVIGPEVLAAVAVEKMEANEVSQLIVMSEGRYVGMVHLHDILREGVA